MTLHTGVAFNGVDGGNDDDDDGVAHRDSRMALFGNNVETTICVLLPERIREKKRGGANQCR